MLNKNYKSEFQLLYRRILNRSKGINKFSEFFPWNGEDGFYELVISGDGPFEFVYKDMIIHVRGESFGNVFILQNQNGVIEQKEYNSVRELLEKSKIEGKTLKEIWDELK